MIVLRITDSDDALIRNLQIRQHDGKAGTLVGPVGQDHHRFFVENQLQLKLQLADRERNGDIVGFHRCHNAPSHGKRHALLTQIGYECARNGRAQEPLLAGSWVVNQGAVLGDNPVKKMEARKHRA